MLVVKRFLLYTGIGSNDDMNRLLNPNIDSPLLCGGDFPSVAIRTPLFNQGRQCESMECIYGVTIMINDNKLVLRFGNEETKYFTKLRQQNKDHISTAG